MQTGSCVTILTSRNDDISTLRAKTKFINARRSLIYCCELIAKSPLLEKFKNYRLETKLREIIAY